MMRYQRNKRGEKNVKFDYKQTKKLHRPKYDKKCLLVAALGWVSGQIGRGRKMLHILYRKDRIGRKYEISTEQDNVGNIHDKICPLTEDCE